MLLGNSGVGKSTLLNLFANRLNLISKEDKLYNYYETID
jgi:putative ribosome biogenesis GTPase RsgA